MKSLMGLMALVALSAGCTPVPPTPPQSTAHETLLPTGAQVSSAGHATILQAPSPAYSEAPPPPDGRPLGGEAAWYAREHGLSQAEARQRLAEQQALRPEFERLLATLRAQEPGNFTAPRLVHAPDWAYVLHFRRAPEATLARYTRNPRFKAAAAPYTRVELDALLQPWAARFQKAGILNGYGSDESVGTAEFMLAVDRAEYQRIASREGWSTPDAITLVFAPALNGVAVDAKAAPFVRLFPQSDRATGMVLTSATSGRIVLEDGCFRVLRRNAPPALAYFAKEAALAIDAQGYLALRDRTSRPGVPEHQAGRIGETFVWGGYGEVKDDMAMVAELRKHCGDDPIVHVGSPTSLHHFRVRPWAIDNYARQKHITRQAAWNEIKACWQRQDADSDAAPVRDCDVSP